MSAKVPLFLYSSSRGDEGGLREDVQILGQSGDNYLLSCGTNGDLTWHAHALLEGAGSHPESHRSLYEWESKAEEKKLLALQSCFHPRAADEIEWPGGVTALDIQAAANSWFPSCLAKYAVSESTRAATKYTQRETGGEGLGNLSSTAGLVFPVAIMGKKLVEQTRRTVSPAAAVCLAAVLEYICAELLELAGNNAKDRAKDRAGNSVLQLRLFVWLLY